MMRIRFLAGLACLSILSGCAAVTEPLGLEDPFAITPAIEDIQRNQAMLNPSLGLTTVAVEGPRGLNAEVSSELQSKIIRALDDLDIAAQAVLMSADWTLKARKSSIVTNEKGVVRRNIIIWRLFDRGKVQRVQFTTPFQGKTLDDIEPRISELAKQVVTRIQPMLLPTAIASGGANAAVQSTRVWVGTIKGAPGDGNLALARALSAVLPVKGMQIEKVADANTWRIQCNVKVEKLSAAQDKVTLVWTLLDPQQKEAGTLTQENPVPRRRLDKKWGDIATFAAEAAADGFRQILQQIRDGQNK